MPEARLAMDPGAAFQGEIREPVEIGEERLVSAPASSVLSDLLCLPDLPVKRQRRELAPRFASSLPRFARCSTNSCACRSHHVRPRAVRRRPDGEPMPGGRNDDQGRPGRGRLRPGGRVGRARAPPDRDPIALQVSHVASSTRCHETRAARSGSTTRRGGDPSGSDRGHDAIGGRSEWLESTLQRAPEGGGVAHVAGATR